MSSTIFSDWPSPAKINLFLHITGQRDNGYHDLQTLFQILDCGDVLDFDITEQPQISMATALPGVADEDNLIVKAAKLLQDYGKTSQGCNIHLRKSLPMGGGIGGGSSNAATTLVALNLLWGLNLPSKTLMELGLQIGADVPVFINGLSTFAEGVGESFYPVEIPSKIYLIVNPGVHVSTAAVFSDPQLPRDTAKIPLQNYSFEDTHNDCEALVCEKYPVIAKTLQWLLQYAPSRMTGTGASLFGVFERLEDAQKALADAPDYCTTFIANGCRRSPLLEKLESAEFELQQT